MKFCDFMKIGVAAALVIAPTAAYAAPSSLPFASEARASAELVRPSAQDDDDGGGSTAILLGILLVIILGAIVVSDSRGTLDNPTSP